MDDSLNTTQRPDLIDDLLRSLYGVQQDFPIEDQMAQWAEARDYAIDNTPPLPAVAAFFAEKTVPWQDGPFPFDIYVDTESMRPANATFSNKHEMGVSVAVTYCDCHGFKILTVLEMEEWFLCQGLVEFLEKHQRVIAHNALGYDYEVLAPFVPDVRARLVPKTLDTMAHLGEVEKQSRFLSLEALALGCLGIRRPSDGKQAAEWAASARYDKVITHCQIDVILLAGVHRFGQDMGYVRYTKTVPKNAATRLAW